MGFITTYTGKMFDPVNPDIEKIDIRDIAHALSLTCRGNGQVQTFFSVGQHCILCCREAMARGYSDRVVLACLVHDASESYMSDVPRPFKAILTEYIAYEEKLLDVIYTRFLGSPLTDEEAKMVKEIDDDMLWFDMKELLKLPVNDDMPDTHVRPDYEFRPFIQVEEEYLRLYDMVKIN